MQEVGKQQTLLELIVVNTYCMNDKRSWQYIYLRELYILVQ